MQIFTNRQYTQVLSAINELLGISLTLSSPEWDLHTPCGMEDSCKRDPHSLTQYFILFYISSVQSLGFPGGTCGKEPACQCGRHKLRFNPQNGKIARRRKWQPSPLFLPRKSHGQRSLVGYSPKGLEEWDATEAAQHSRKGQLKITFAEQSKNARLFVKKSL